MTEVTGTLLFECSNYRTVDENDLPAPDEFNDGLKDFKCIEYCCDIMSKFNEESKDGYSNIKMTTHPYPDLLSSRGKPTLILNIEYDGWESSYEEEIPIKSCPWCQIEPTLKVTKKKRIKRCKEQVVPQQVIPQHTKQSCEIEVVED